MIKLKSVLYGFALCIAATACQAQKSDFDFDVFKISPAELENYLATIRVDGKYGIINANGKLIIPAEYEGSADWFIWDKVILEKDNLKGIYSLSNTELLPIENPDLSYVKAYRKEDCFFQLRTGNDSFDYLDVDLNKIEDPLWYNNRKSLRYEYKNYKSKGPVDFTVSNLLGEELLSFKASEFLFWIGPFNDGMAPIFLTKHEGVEQPHKEPVYYGFMNEKGKMVVPIQYELRDRDQAYSFGLEDNNRIRFEDGKALVWKDDQKFFIDKKGTVIKILDKNVRLVYPVLKDGTRLLDLEHFQEDGSRRFEIQLVDSDLNVIYEDGQDGWEYTLKGIGFRKFMDNGYCIQNNPSTKEFRIVNHRLEETFKHTFADEEFVYDLKVTDIDTLYWLQRYEKDSVDGPMTRYNHGVGVFQGEKRLISINGVYLSDWIRDPYIYTFRLGLKHRWYEKDGVRYSELRDLENNLLKKFENEEVTVLWDEKKDKHFGVMSIKKDKSGARLRTRLNLDGETLYVNADVISGFRHKDKYNLLDKQFYQNPGFTLKFDEADVAKWYSQIPALNASEE